MNDKSNVIENVIRGNIVGNDSTETLPGECTFEEIGLTSFGLMRSLLLIEKELDVKVITPKKVQNLKTIDDIYALFGN